MELDLIFYRENEDIRNCYCENEKEIKDFYLKEITDSDYYLIKYSSSFLVCESSYLLTLLIDISNSETAIGVKCITESEYRIFHLITNMQ